MDTSLALPRLLHISEDSVADSVCLKLNKTGNAFQGRCLTLDKIKYNFKITLHSRRRNVGIFRQGLRESLTFAICLVKTKQRNCRLGLIS